MSNRQIVPSTTHEEMIQTFKDEIERSRNLYRPNYSIVAYMVYAPWKGQLKLFEGIYDEYVRGAPLFIIREKYGRLNDLAEAEYMLHKLFFHMKFAGKLNDIEAIKRECLWEASNEWEVLEAWNKEQKLPDGKLSPEAYIVFTFDKSLVYGALDLQLRKLFSESLSKYSPWDSRVLDIEKVMIEKAFVNIISIMDETVNDKCIEIIDSHWEEHYQEEATFRNINLIITDCTDGLRLQR
ncbi:MAG: hypothetical protein IPJ94_27905 [Chloroflexi bacterium]|nr:hypothetical protein [Chloroflexota bacterium]